MGGGDELTSNAKSVGSCQTVIGSTKLPVENTQ